MSDTSNFSSATTARAEKSFFKKCCSFCARQFSLNGHLSYAFIYGSWEIVRARKVGTTHTKVDYVVYRLFYPVILIGAGLFAVVAESDLEKFFCLIEVWSMILHIIYAFVFLQNVLANNLHRENVKHRQKIPERLVVTDEIEKGGHKFYICKRYSILPTEKLYYTERFIWLVFNTLASMNVTVMVGHMFGQIQIEYKPSDYHEKLRAYSMGTLILADVLLSPIPMRLAHVIFPIIYFSIYHVFLLMVFEHNGLVLYKSFDFRNTSTDRLLELHFARVSLIAVVHCILMGFAALRDYIISLLDDSRTPKQLQNLRSQKRLARRKLMNYIEGPDGRITGISLEKHNYVPGLDEVIRTEKEQKRKNRVSPAGIEDGEEVDSDDDELEEIKMFRKDGGGDNVTAAVAEIDSTKEQKSVTSYGDEIQESVPITTKTKPPPKPRYQKTPEKDEAQFSSSSSSSLGDEMEAIRKSIKRLPSPPKSPEHGHHSFDFDLTKDPKNKRQSRIPVPLHKFGILVKPRDSKENIYHKMDNPDDSPPTPPFVRLVQTLIKVNKEAKGEVQQEQKDRKKKFNNVEKDGKAIHTTSGSAFVKVVRVVRSQEEKRVVVQPRIGLSTKAVIKKQQQEIHKKIRASTTDKIQIDQLINDAVSTRMSTLEKKDELQVVKNPSVGDTSKNVRGSWDTEKSRPVASKVVHIQGSTQGNIDDKGEKKSEGASVFHQELTDKLQKERNKLLGVPEKEVKKEMTTEKKRPLKKKTRRLKGILRQKDFGGGGGERLPGARIKRREERLMRRRNERAVMGKHGLPVYDPLMVPETMEGAPTVTTTSFHYLGTKLKGDKVDKTTVPHEDLPLYRKHPGIGTLDDGQLEDESKKGRATIVPAKSLVAFHPIVKYFDVNEVKKEVKQTKPARQSRWSRKY